MEKAVENNSASSRTWKEFASEVMQDHGAAIAIGAAATALVIASRGKLASTVEEYLPKLTTSLETEGAAAEFGLVRHSLESNATGVTKLQYDFDASKLAEATGLTPIPSMSVAAGKLEQRVSLVDSNSPVAKLYEQANPAIFHLHDLRGDKEQGIGTAWLTEDNCLVTAQHCAAAVTNPFIRIAGGDRLPLSVVANDFSADVSLLKFKEPVENLPKPLTLGWGSSVKQNDWATNLGYPASSNRLVMTDGIVVDVGATRLHTGNDKAADLATMLTQSAKVNSRAQSFGGSSGAPIFVDGEVVAVHVASHSDTGLGRATAVEHVRLLLDQVRKNPTLPPEGLNIKSIGRVLGTGKNYTVKVEKLDIAVGDVVEKP